MVYKRRSVEKAIVLALRDLGGSASRKSIRKSIADNEYDGLSYNDVFSTKQGKTGMYSPFMFDFNFGIKNLYSVGYIEQPKRGQDIVLTQLGENDELTSYPRPEQEEMIRSYWDKKDEARKKKNKIKQQEIVDNSANSDDKEDTDNTNWKLQLINQLKQFSPGKFESFSRLQIGRAHV